ncbi:MAG: uroporphyrinogen decarboxylase family protein [Mariniphaga sp.]|nr:uroporphyrinogen decarboxylase family protein [Mariniphaga sp.]MDD4425009.1 uroporphyrinogen decarboxylase family protein [Mariniphaga sp.]
MNSRERFIRTICRNNPDRPAVFATFTPQVAKRMSEKLGVDYEEPLDSLLSTRNSHTQLLLKLGNDAVGIAACAPYDAPTVTDENGIITNEWGMKFINKGLYNEFIEYPLAHAEKIEDVERYLFPDPFAPGRFDEARKAVARYGKDYGIIADLETSVFETAWYLTGLEKFLMDLLVEPPYLNVLLDKILNINIETGKELIRLGADMIWCGDDFGGQNGLIMDLDTWRYYFKPRMRKMFSAFREINPDIKIAWHTCGAVRPLIPEFIELGIDFLNPIQPRAAGMEPQALMNDFGKSISFFGGICVQDLMPNGTPQQIREEIKRRTKIHGREGGYIIAPAHNFQDDTPDENILAFFEGVKAL